MVVVVDVVVVVGGRVVVVEVVGELVVVVVVGCVVLVVDVVVLVVVVVSRVVEVVDEVLVEVVVTDVVVVVVGEAPDSYAPMSQVASAPSGRPNPRWSRLFTGGAMQTVPSPASIAGLAPVHPALGAPMPVHSAMVCVGPPLVASPAGSSSGFVLQNEVPLALVQPLPVKPQVVPSSML